MSQHTCIGAGWPRSGTSREMEAWQAGGVRAVRNPHRSKVLIWAAGDERVNTDFYELFAAQMSVAGFPREHWGKAIKLLGYWPCSMAPHPDEGHYLVCLLTRAPRDIRKSYVAKFHARPIEMTDDEYWQRVDDVETILSMRRDCKVVRAKFADITGDPLTHYRRLADEGWPIDPEKAARVIDQAKVHFG